MKHLPEAIQKVIKHFDDLPGIGPKNAARLAYHILQRKQAAINFAKDLDEALEKVTFCSQCQNLSDQAICDICQDTARNKKQICVIAEIQDMQPIEHINSYKGLYHVLHGTINPLEGVTPDDVKIQELIARVQNHDVEEIILALDATMEGEATAMYLSKVLKPLNIIVSKLGRGMPMGSNIEYTDEVTLSSAFENRKKI